jgi:hypothetical protein
MKKQKIDPFYAELTKDNSANIQQPNSPQINPSNNPVGESYSDGAGWILASVLGGALVTTYVLLFLEVI